MLQTGQVLDGKFTILRLIGEGGMGAVYEAQHAFLGRRVAIKVLSTDFAHNEEAVRRFYREAQAAAQIGHENICEVTDIGRTGDSPYIVMQLLQGRSLARAIAEGAPFPIGRAVDIASQTLEALAAAHAAGIVHRDMKPDNIFLTKVAGREDFVKLLDFGISKVRASDTATKLTRDGTVLGTPHYMSPEQARGATEVDERADVWAVGVIVFEMLTGRVPFEGANYNQVIFNVATAPIPRLRALREGVTPEFEAVVMRALERDVARRYRSAPEFREALVDAWMGTGESGFAVSAVPTPRPVSRAASGQPAPAPKLDAASSGPATVPEIAAGPLVATPPAAVVAGEGAKDVAVVAATDTAGPSSSGSGVPTSPRGMRSVARLAERGTMELTPRAAEAELSRGAVLVATLRRKAPVVPVAIAAAAVIAVVVFLAVRPTGSSRTEDLAASVADASGSGARETDAGALATRIALVAPQDAALGAAPPEAALRAASTGDGTGVGSPATAEETAPDVGGKDAGASPAASEDAAPTPRVKPAADVGPDRARAVDAWTETTAGTPTVGTLSVVTVPPTEISIDGVPFGRAPFFHREVAAGPHQILFVNEAEGIRHQERLVIIAGRTSEIRRNAEQLGGGRPANARDGGTVASPPDAGLLLDGVRFRRRDAQ